MKSPENQYLMKFETLILSRSQSLIQDRPQYFTQSEVARRLGVSLKTIQNFEAYRCVSPYLCFGYEQLIKSK